jgi:hypothetical protein
VIDVMDSVYPILHSSRAQTKFRCNIDFPLGGKTLKPTTVSQLPHHQMPPRMAEWIFHRISTSLKEAQALVPMTPKEQAAWAICELTCLDLFDERHPLALEATTVFSDLMDRIGLEKCNGSHKNR